MTIEITAPAPAAPTNPPINPDNGVAPVTAPVGTTTVQTPAPSPTPAPLPVTLPEAPAPAPAANPDTSHTFQYDPTGDAGLDYALDFIGRQGYGDTHPAVQAAQQGDFSLIEAELATKNVPGAQQVVALAKQAYERHTAEASQREQALASFAAQTAGSPENWNTVRAWAAAEATPEEKAQVNAAIAQGGLVAQGVIRQLVDLYSQKHTLAKAPAAVAPGATAVGNGPTEPMTAQRYAQAVEELRRSKGREIEGTPEYAALQSQRLAARRAGY